MIKVLNEFFQQDIVSIRDLNKQKLELVFDVTDKLINKSRIHVTGSGKVLGCLFFEPSTRTRLSFEAAMMYIGGSNLGISSDLSSIRKGESLADTIKIMSLYSDIIVLRHPLDGSSRFAAKISEKPVINGGSGTEEHPTQAIQDLYTIKKEKKKIDGLKIGIIGDLKYGRTVYSLLHALSNYDVNVYLISPETLKIRSDSIYDIKKKIQFTESTNLEEYIHDLDVIYVTRIQKERFPDEEEYVKVKGSYVIDLKLVKKLKNSAIILHPLPRLEEITYLIDKIKQAKYFKQAEYGKYTRAALLGLVLNKNGFND